MQQTIERQDQLQLVAFRLGAEDYAIPIDMVESIIKLGSLTTVPGSPPHVRGVMNLRGRVMSVVDLRQRFNMPPAEDQSDGRILVVQYADSTIGLLVDSVSEVFTLDDNQFQQPPAELGNGLVGGVDGIIHSDDRLIVLLNVEAILNATADADSDHKSPTVS
jgi:purine-binding chemotaxis protein CheW